MICRRVLIERLLSQVKIKQADENKHEEQILPAIEADFFTARMINASFPKNTVSITGITDKCQVRESSS